MSTGIGLRQIGIRMGLAAGAALALLAFSPAMPAAVAVNTYKADLYNSRSVLYQDPDRTACVAAAAQMMLNMTVYQSNLSYLSSSNAVFQLPMRWRVDVTFAKEETILAYTRANMTMLATSAGTDAHGWRNALNYYGWGSTRAGVYRDSAYATFDLAAKAVVSSVARRHKPVGILARSGGHAQLVTGYVVTGQDPAVGDGYTIVGVYITDPLVSAAMRDTYVPMNTWRSGGTTVRFTAYTQTDSPYVDPIDLKIGKTEWLGKWVIIDPLR